MKDFNLIGISTNLIPLFQHRYYEEITFSLSLVELFKIQFAFGKQIENYIKYSHQESLDLNKRWLVLSFLWFKLRFFYERDKKLHLLYDDKDSRNPWVKQRWK